MVSCSWDAPGQAYHALQCLSGAGTTCPLASSPQPNTAREKPLLLHHLGKLHAVARQCALRDVATPLPPLVATPDSRGGSEVEVSVVLQLPASGMRLVGCEASPTATQRNGGDAASIVAQPAQAEVALLVRRQAGPYLPVRVVACAGDAELGAGVGGGAEASVLVHATVRRTLLRDGVHAESFHPTEWLRFPRACGLCTHRWWCSWTWAPPRPGASSPRPSAWSCGAAPLRPRHLHPPLPWARAAQHRALSTLPLRPRGWSC